MKAILMAITMASLLLAGCATPQEIEGSSGQVKEGFWRDYLDSYQMQGNGTMRLYRRYSDVDAYCVLDKALQEKLRDYFNEGPDATYVVSYRMPTRFEFTGDMYSTEPGRCYTESKLALWVVTDVTAPVGGDE